MTKLKYDLWVFILVLIFSLVVPVRAEIDPAQTPDQGDYPEAGAVILKSEKMADYSQKPYQIKVNKTIKILNQRGIERFGEIKIRYDQEMEDIEIRRAMTIKPDGSQVEVKKKAINDITPPDLSEANIYSNVRQRVMSMPALEKGAVITYTYIKEIKKPVINGEFWLKDYFQTVEPVKNISLTIKAPSDTNIDYYNKSGEVVPEIKKGAQYNTYHWERKDVPAVKEEKAMPPLADIADYVIVSSLNSWEEVGYWYQDLIDSQYQLNDEIKDKIIELTEDKKNERDRIEALYNFTAQNIRYVGLEFGMGGYKPHSSQEIFANKYGDCKDQAILLIAMLNEIGIRAEPVLINASTNPDLSVPTPAHFNHMIVYLPDQDLYLDPTSDIHRYGTLPPQDQGKNVFLPFENTLSKTEYEIPMANKEEINQQVEITSEGKAMIEIDWHDYGYYDAIYRSIFKQYNQNRRERVLSQIVKQSLSGAIIKDYSIEGVDSLENNFNISLTVESNQYLNDMENLYSFKPLYFSFNLHQLVSNRERELPIYLGTTLGFKRKVVINLPDNYSLNHLPEDTSIKNEVGSLFLDYNHSGDDEIIVEMTMKVNKAQIGVGEYKEAQKLFNKTREVLQNQILLKKSKE